MESDMLPPPHAHPELQAIESIESSHPLAIHRPALTTEQHPDPQSTKPRASMGEIPNAHSLARTDPSLDCGDTRRRD